MDIPQLPVFSTAQEITHTPIKRAEAARQGLRFFFTGKACSHGHVARRYVSTGTCVTCQRSHSDQHQKLYRTLRVQRAIQTPWIIVEGEEGQLATIKATAEAFGCKVKDMQRGPREIAREVRMAPPGWKPPADLVAPVITHTQPIGLASGMGLVTDAWQSTSDDRSQETVETNPGMVWREPHAESSPPLAPVPPHLLRKP